MHTHSITSSVQCVRLALPDSSAIHQLEELCFTLPWSKEQIEKSFEQKAFLAYGLKEKGQLVAYVLLYHFDEQMEIVNIAVTPSLRSKGLGRALLNFVLHRAKDLGILSLILEVRPSNAPALGLYNSVGFAQIGTRPRYYSDTGEDALLLECTLCL